MLRYQRSRGTCEACGKNPRRLVRIESGQQVCRTCLRRIRQPKPANRHVPAGPVLLNEAAELGIEVPEGASQTDVRRRIRLARRQFPLTAAVLEEDEERLAQLQDDVLCYVADLWQQLAGQQPSDAKIPFHEQRQTAAALILERRATALAIQRVQRQRQRFRAELEAEFLAEHAGAKFDWDAHKQPIADDAACLESTAWLRARWKEHLPKKRGLLRRWLGGGGPDASTKFEQ